MTPYIERLSKQALSIYFQKDCTFYMKSVVLCILQKYMIHQWITFSQTTVVYCFNYLFL